MYVLCIINIDIDVIYADYSENRIYEKLFCNKYMLVYVNIIYSSSASENGALILCFKKIYFGNVETFFRVPIIALRFIDWEMNSS